MKVISVPQNVQTVHPDVLEVKRKKCLGREVDLIPYT
jgi:hypothetical protein